MCVTVCVAGLGEVVWARRVCVVGLGTLGWTRCVTVCVAGLGEVQYSWLDKV